MNFIGYHFLAACDVIVMAYVCNFQLLVILPGVVFVGLTEQMRQLFNVTNLIQEPRRSGVRPE